MEKTVLNAIDGIPEIGSIGSETANIDSEIPEEKKPGAENPDGALLRKKSSHLPSSLKSPEKIDYMPTAADPGEHAASPLKKVASGLGSLGKNGWDSLRVRFNSKKLSTTATTKNHPPAASNINDDAFGRFVTESSVPSFQ